MDQSLLNFLEYLIGFEMKVLATGRVRTEPLLVELFADFRFELIIEFVFDSQFRSSMCETTTVSK